jgi:predicted TIM-barrel fold metal-dependent hydrolase
LDILDSQLHIFPGLVDATLEAMNALGIRSVLLDDFWYDPRTHDPAKLAPGYMMASGVWRPSYAQAEYASLLHPDRFSYLVRLERRDPELESVMRVVGSSPHARAFRISPTWTLEELAVFSAGGYEPLLDIAQQIGLPICVIIPGYVELLPPYLEKYPKLTFVVDHCGMGQAQRPAGRPEADDRRTTSPPYFDEVLKLAHYPNVILKWGHEQRLFQAPDYPYEPARRALRRAVRAFGADRILWASDNSVIPDHTWSDMLHAIKGDPELSRDEREWILGRTARRVFRWPAA